MVLSHVVWLLAATCRLYLSRKALACEGCSPLPALPDHPSYHPLCDQHKTSDLPLQLMIQDIVHYRVLHEQNSEQIISLQHE